MTKDILYANYVRLIDCWEIFGFVLTEALTLAMVPVFVTMTQYTEENLDIF